MLFDAPWPKKLTSFGRVVLATWATVNGVFVILAVVELFQWLK